MIDSIHLQKIVNLVDNLLFIKHNSIFYFKIVTKPDRSLISKVRNNILKGVKAELKRDKGTLNYNESLCHSFALPFHIPKRS